MGDFDTCGSCHDLLARITALDTDHRDDPGERPLIMIVDDEEFLRLSLRLAFRGHFQLVIAESAEDALHKLTDEVHAVVLDVKMRGKDGFWTYEQIRERYTHLPIIFYSAYEDLKQPYEVLNKYRPYGYIFKGREFRELLDAVTGAVTHYQDLRRVMRGADKFDEIVECSADLRRPSRALAND